MCFKWLTWTSKHGVAKILLPIIFPPLVEPITPFDITYTVQNVGNNSDVIYAYLSVNGKELPGSRWSTTLTVNQAITKKYRHPGIAGQTKISIKAGYS
jgi:hypothetical protein